MDSLTHIVMGAVIGEATLGRKIGNKALLWGAAISTLPDFDVFISPFLKPVDGLFFHRGITHSLLFTLIAIPILAWLIQRFDKKHNANFKDWVSLIGVSLLSHILIDCFNTYGTGIFEPFSNMRISYDSMSIVDISIILVLAILIIPIFLLKKQEKIRRILAWIGIAFLVGFLSFTIFNKTNVESKVREQLAFQNIKYIRLHTSPLPLTDFMWKVVVEDDKGYHIGYYYNLDSKKEINFRYILRNDKYIENLKDRTEIKDLIRFTKGYYKVDSLQNGLINVYDLRYGSLDYKDENAYVFTFGIKETKNGIEITRSHPNRKINPSNIKKYLRRILFESDN